MMHLPFFAHSFRHIRYISIHSFPVEIAFLTIYLFFLIPTPYVYTNHDSGVYLELALSLANDGTYTLYDKPFTGRGPVFPFIISLFLDPNTFDMSTVKYIPRLSFSLCILLVFLISRRVYGRLPAWTTVFFLLATAYFHNTSSHFLLDYTMSVLILLSLYLYVLAISTQRRPGVANLSFLSGIALGLAFLAKQVAIFFVPIPLIFGLLNREYSSSPRFLAMFYCGLNNCSEL